MKSGKNSSIFSDNSVTISRYMSDDMIQKSHEHLRIARKNAYEIINGNKAALTIATRLFATDICNFACAYFSNEWHCAAAVGLKYVMDRKVEKRLGVCNSSILSEAFNRDIVSTQPDNIFQGDALTNCVKCVASACLILASIICNDLFTDEIRMAKLITSCPNLNYAPNIYYAETIRRYGYFIFSITCRGCPSRIPSVSTEFVLLQTERHPKNDTAIISKQRVGHLLFSVSCCAVLRNRYSAKWLAECCSILTDYLIFNKTDKQYLEKKDKHWYDCLFDCFVVWMSLRAQNLQELGEHIAQLYSNKLEKKKRKRLTWIDQLCLDAADKTWQNASMEWVFKRKLFNVNVITKFQTKFEEEIKRPRKQQFLTCSFNEYEQLFAQPNGQGTFHLGSGSYGNIRRTYAVEAYDDRACNLNKSKQMAVKEFNCANAAEGGATWLNDISDAIQEINTLYHFKQHSNILKSHLAVMASDSESKYVKQIAMWMPIYQCDLRTWIHSRRKSLQGKYVFLFESLNHFCNLTSQLCKGLSILHKNGFLHRDIKTPNILISADEQKVVISDFGSSLFLYASSQNNQRHGDTSTLWWRCPEHILQISSGPNRKRYQTSTAADVWSLSVCVVEMILANNPFSSCMNEKQMIMLQKRHCSTTLQCEHDIKVINHFETFFKNNRINVEETDAQQTSAFQRRVVTRLFKNKATKKISRKLADYLFNNMLHLNPKRRDSAETIGNFFRHLAAELE